MASQVITTVQFVRGPDNADLNKCRSEQGRVTYTSTMRIVTRTGLAPRRAATAQAGTSSLSSDVRGRPVLNQSSGSALRHGPAEGGDPYQAVLRRCMLTPLPRTAAGRPPLEGLGLGAFGGGGADAG
jgi:hypothetical protein